MKRRVLHVVRPASGGIRQHVLSLISHLDEEKFASSIAAPTDFLDALPPELPVVQAFSLDIAPRLALLRDVRAARRLGKLSADIVHAHGLRAGFVAALTTKDRPLVVTLHNLLIGRASKFAAAFVAHRASRIIVVSPAIAVSGAVVIPNGVEISRFSALPRVKNERFTVGCIARLSLEKGVDILVDAARMLENVTFLVAGNGPEWENLTKTAGRNVKFLGSVNDVRDVLRKIDVLVVPSRLEGQGIVALEAMAAGVPVIAARVGGLAEMLTDGETARLVKPNNPAALADAVKELEGDEALRQRLSENGEKLVRERYDVREMARRVGEVYETIARVLENGTTSGRTPSGGSTQRPSD